MPRGLEIPLGPFRGLNLNAHPNMLEPGEAAHCMDTDTSQGCLRRRPFITEMADAMELQQQVGVLFSGSLYTKRVLAAWSQPTSRLFFDYDGGASYNYLSFTNDGTPRTQFVIARKLLFGLSGTTTALTSANRGYSFKAYYNTDTAAWKTARIGIVAPTGIPTTALDAGGSLTSGSTYSYRISYYNTYTGTESAVGSATTSRTPSGGNLSILLTGIPDPTVTGDNDAQCTHVRIYRTKETVDSTWYYIGAVTAGTTSYDDGAADSTIDKTAANACRFVPQLPPNGNIGCYHKERMWYVDTDDGCYVTPSEFQQPELCSYQTIFRVKEGKADGITALYSALGYLFVFTRRSIYYIGGNGPESFVMDLLTDRTGCIARDSIVELGGALYFAGLEGVYRLTGENVELLSEKIGPLYRAIGSGGGSYADMTAGFDPISGCYVLNYFDQLSDYANGIIGVPPRQGGFGSSLSPGFTYDFSADWTFFWQLAYNIRNDTWNRWGIKTSAICSGYVPSIDRVALLLAFPYGAYAGEGLFPGKFGYVDAFSLGTGDFGEASNPADWIWRTGALTFETKRSKRFFYIGLQWDRGKPAFSFAEAFELAYSTDDRAPKVLEQFGTGMAQDDQKLWAIGSLGRTLQLNIVAFKGNDVALSNLTVSAQAIGRR